MLNSLVAVFKAKVDPLNTNSDRHIKLLEHAFKLHTSILDKSFSEENCRRSVWPYVW